MIKKENLPPWQNRKKNYFTSQKKKLEAKFRFLGIKFITSRLLWSFKIVRKIIYHLHWQIKKKFVVPKSSKNKKNTQINIIKNIEEHQIFLLCVVLYHQKNKNDTIPPQLNLQNIIWTSYLNEKQNSVVDCMLHFMFNGICMNKKRFNWKTDNEDHIEKNLIFFLRDKTWLEIVQQVVLVRGCQFWKLSKAFGDFGNIFQLE